MPEGKLPEAFLCKILELCTCNNQQLESTPTHSMSLSANIPTNSPKMPTELLGMDLSSRHDEAMHETR